MDDVCPERFREPLAPYVAARRAGRAVSIAGLDTARARLESGRDALVVEGAGGLLVTIAEAIAFDTLFRRWNLDCIVVAANRLGAINHTLLTVRAALAAGLRVPAVVLNSMCPPGSTPAELTNLDTLRELIPDAMILPFPYNGGAHDLRAIC